MMIGEGMKVRFVPSFNDSVTYTPEERRAATITGTVVYINWVHKCLWVEFDCGGTKQREAFSFMDIGTAVTVCG